MRYKVLIMLCCLWICELSFGQKKDVIVVIDKQSSNEHKGQTLHKVEIKNLSDTPLVILHSVFINLIDNFPQALAPQSEERSKEIYSLSYAAKDTSYDYEGPIVNFNGEAILPLQSIRFELLVPKSEREKKLEFEYLYFPDFCYKDFRQSVFRNASQWYRKYKRVKVAIDLKNE